MTPPNEDFATNLETWLADELAQNLLPDSGARCRRENTLRVFVCTNCTKHLGVRKDTQPLSACSCGHAMIRSY